MVNLIRQLAVLCRNRIKASFPGAECTIDDSVVKERLSCDYDVGETYLLSITLRKSTRKSKKHYWAMNILFYKDHAMISSMQPQGREVSYNDPKLIGIILSELEAQVKV